MPPHDPSAFPFRVIDIEPEGWRAIIDTRVRRPNSNRLAIYAPWHGDRADKAIRKMRVLWADAQRKRQRILDNIAALNRADDQVDEPDHREQGRLL